MGAELDVTDFLFLFNPPDVVAKMLARDKVSLACCNRLVVSLFEILNSVSMFLVQTVVNPLYLFFVRLKLIFFHLVFLSLNLAKRSTLRQCPKIKTTLNSELMKYK